MTTKTTPEKTDDVYKAIYEIVKLIPLGRVSTYGDIAEAIGLRSGARLVGYALNNAPYGVPAHRVVNSKGLLTGKHHFSPPSMMEELLAGEGIQVHNDKVMDFENLCWRPFKEL